MPHFFIKTQNIRENRIQIEDKDLYNHLVRARRVKLGEKVLFIDENKMQYETKISAIEKTSLMADICKSYKSERVLNINLTAARCVLKQDADFSAIQKATELGVQTIIPLISDNCAVKESVIRAKADKFRKIAEESVKQCERADFPQVLPPVSLDEFLKTKLKDYDKVLLFSEREKTYTIKKYFKDNPFEKSDKILAIIGCEGGFSEREFHLFEQYNLPEITLGKLIMRADTALTAALFGIIQEVSE
ncbi:MAG: 16S rRNA (uracil(1498)-N(3))-methyltransferase [Candidatus Gastranaerophilales bacterium]|nr:16S rRNA (uracil(1498)-N(3))-methyltransferase [Candidatus Gastranaerophilales bacterium]